MLNLNVGKQSQLATDTTANGVARIAVATSAKSSGSALQETGVCRMAYDTVLCKNVKRTRQTVDGSKSAQRVFADPLLHRQRSRFTNISAANSLPASGQSTYGRRRSSSIPSERMLPGARNGPTVIPSPESLNPISLAIYSAAQDSGTIEWYGTEYQLQFDPDRREPSVVCDPTDTEGKRLQMWMTDLWVQIQAQAAKTKLLSSKTVRVWLRLPGPRQLEETGSNPDNTWTSRTKPLDQEWNDWGVRIESTFQLMAISRQDSINKLKWHIIEQLRELEPFSRRSWSTPKKQLDRVESRVANLESRQAENNVHLDEYRTAYRQIFELASRCPHNSIRSHLQSLVIDIYRSMVAYALPIPECWTIPFGELSQQSMAARLTEIAKNFNTVQMQRYAQLWDLADPDLPDNTSELCFDLRRQLVGTLRSRHATWQEIETTMQALEAQHQQIRTSYAIQRALCERMNRLLNAMPQSVTDRLHKNSGEIPYSPDVFARIVTVASIRDELQNGTLLSEEVLTKVETEVAEHASAIRYERWKNWFTFPRLTIFGITIFQGRRSYEPAEIDGKLVRYQRWLQMDSSKQRRYNA